MPHQPNEDHAACSRSETDSKQPCLDNIGVVSPPLVVFLAPGLVGSGWDDVGEGEACVFRCVKRSDVGEGKEEGKEVRESG